MAKVTGEGSIIQMEKDKPKSKCRKWQLRVPIGLNPRTGKYQQKTRVVEGTFTKAKADLREFIKEIEHDEVQGRTSYTFEEYCMRYLEIRAAKKEVAPTTQVRQEWQFRAAIRHIGKVNLAAVTPTMLDDMYIAMLKGDTLSGRPSSGSYVNQIHDNITLVFEHAIKEGILVKNPCDAANPPKMDTREKRAMKPEQIQELIEGLDPEVPRECAYLVAITMGLRRGEVCGLSWKDIDIENGIVDVSHSFDGLGTLKETKTKAGMRLLPLPEVTREALLRQKAAQAEQFAKTNQTIADGMTKLGNAFTEYVGKAAQASGLTSAINQVLSALAGHMDAVGAAAAAAASILLSAYVPAMARAATAGAVMLATNPFLALAAAIGTAAFALAA